MSKVAVDQTMQLALQRHQAGQLAEAEKLYRQVLAEKPNHPDALHLLGVVAAQVGQTATAIRLMSAAITISPATPHYHNDLGNALRHANKLEESAAAYRQALRLKPDDAVARNNLGNVLCDQGNLDEGIAEYRAAIKLRPAFGGAWANLGKALRDIGMIDDSIATLRKALSLQPDYAEAHHNLSLVLLLKGDYESGWAEHEWRLQLKDSPWKRREPLRARWDGSDLNGRTILILSEQGLGDTIQFARFLPMVAARGGRIILQCQTALHRLLAGTSGVERIIGMDDPMPGYDVHCPLLSLPYIFGTRLDSIPAAAAYLAADAGLSRDWAARLAAVNETKVGIVWAGAAGNSDNHLRSAPLSSLAPPAAIPGIRWFSLQKGQAAAQIAAAPAGMNLIDHTAELNDFADTAALIANLDLVIAVDTAVSHLAGAMGKPVWLMLRRWADWRWLLDRDDSPWYPTMRLFRQRSAGDWQEVFQRAAQALNAIPPRT